MKPLVEHRQPPTVEPASAEPLADEPQGELRLDGPHRMPGLAEPVPPEPAVSVDREGAAPPAASHDQLLAQAQQIAEHLRQQCAELDRREQRLHASLAQLDQEQRAVRLYVSHFESQVHDREEALLNQEAESARKAAACLALEQELQALHEDLNRQQAELQQQREELVRDREATLGEISTAREHLDKWVEEARQELETERTECDAILATERSHHRQQFEQERRELLAERDRLTSELHQERLRLENRHRFQEEHLQKLRKEFEAAQSEARLEQQQQQTWLAERSAQIEARASQIALARERLEAQGHALDREAEQLSRSRKMFEAAAESDRRLLNAERQQWEDERESQQADLRRQHDLLATHAESLETRRVRLDRLRAELEDTHRKSLETRLAVEEANVRLCDAAGAEIARQRVEEARGVLSEYYRHTRDDLISLRHELAGQEARLRAQSEELHEEREALTNWIAEQERQFQQQRDELDAARRDLTSREHHWHVAADRWAAEKAEAETAIRDLLSQLDPAAP